MRVVIGSDHAGYDAKTKLISFLKKKKIEVIDVGTSSKESCDYPVFGKAVAKAIANKTADFGIVICSTGEGIAMSVNKVKGVRCGIGYNEEVCKLMRQHNNAQVISFGANEMSFEKIKNRTMVFLNTKFSEGERHIRRIKLMEK